MEKQRWAVVLAAGSGTRLQKITGRSDGLTVPKQYCSLHGGPSLLRLALVRAFTAVPRDRVLCVVAAEHQHWWSRELEELPFENIVVQPRNRGTAVGTLLPLLVARARDRASRLMFLPADHYVADESLFAKNIGSAYDAIEANSDKVTLLGIEPDEPETELGYILAESSWHRRVHPVRQFVEKPPIRRARTLVGDGALWNSFVFGAEATFLLKLLRRRVPQTVRAFEELGCDPTTNRPALESLYSRLENADLSKRVFSGSERDLVVLRIPPCGWTDLGTPERVARCLSDQTPVSMNRLRRYAYRPTHVDLESACSNTFVYQSS